MRDRPDRKFTLLDAMILVAGTAVGLALIQNFRPKSLTYPFEPIGPLSSRWWGRWSDQDWSLWASQIVTIWFYALTPLILSWTVTVLVLRIRSTRPRLMRLMRQPGFVATLTATTGIALWVPMPATKAISLSFVDYPPHNFLAIVASSMVCSSWMVLLVSGRRQASSGWIDRLGRLVAATWLATIPLLMVASLHVLF